MFGTHSKDKFRLNSSILERTTFRRLILESFSSVQVIPFDRLRAYSLTEIIISDFDDNFSLKMPNLCGISRNFAFYFILLNYATLFTLATE